MYKLLFELQILVGSIEGSEGINSFVKVTLFVSIKLRLPHTQPILFPFPLRWLQELTFPNTHPNIKNKKEREI